jgi:hypothetical protein
MKKEIDDEMGRRKHIESQTNLIVEGPWSKF